MSKSSQVKRPTMGSRTLKFLRDQSGLSVRGAAAASGIGSGVINHLEHGRIRIHQHHLDALLKAYGTTEQTYQMFASGGVAMPQNLRSECLQLVQQMSSDQLRTAHPVLLSLSTHK